MLGGVAALIFATQSTALADCTPAAANNVTATCTGTTTNQGAGAPGTSADTHGYGSSAVTGLTVNVAAGAGNTVFGTTNGIELGSGTVINNAGASVTGGQRAINSFGTVTVVNSGVLTGTTADGIFAFSGATVTNNAGASIIANNEGIIANNFVNVTNSGSIVGDFSAIRAQSGATATVTNNAGASITATDFGIASSGAANITNSGTVTASNTAIALSGGGTVTNNAGGIVSSSGGTAILVFGGTTNVFNAGTISGPTAIDFAGSGNTLTLAAGSSITGNVLGTGSDTLRLGGTVDATFDLSQIGAAAQYRGFGSFRKIGSSTWTLTNSPSQVTPWTIDAGTLRVNGSLAGSTVTVNNGGTLGGSGTVGSTTIMSGGILAPGNSIGTITVSGNLTFNSGGVYAVEVSPTAADRTNVSGTATLAGTVNAQFEAGSYIAKQYTIVAATTRAGTFDALTTSNLPAGFVASLSYGIGDVLLNLALANPISPTSALPGNQQGPANAIANYFNNGGALPPGFVTLVGLTGAQQQNGYAQVSGEGGHGATQSAAYNASKLFMGAMLDPAVHGRETDDGASSFAAEESEALGYAGERNVTRAQRDAYAAVTPRDRRVRDSFGARWGLWASGYGGSSSVSGNAAAGTHDTSSRIYGTVVGADYRIGRDTLVGIAMGGAGTNFSTSESLGSGRADLFQLGFHGRHDFGAAYLTGALAYGWQSVTTDRTVSVSGTDRLRADFSAHTFAARAEAGYRFAIATMGVTPYAALQATTVHLPAYAENVVSGSGTFALSFASQTGTNVRSELGLRSDKSYALPEGLLTLRAGAAWAHDSNTDRTINPTFQSLPGSSSFTVNGAVPAADSALVSAGAEMKWQSGWSVAAMFGGEFSRTTQSYAGKGSIRYAW